MFYPLVNRNNVGLQCDIHVLKNFQTKLYLLHLFNSDKSSTRVIRIIKYKIWINVDDVEPKKTSVVFSIVD